MRGHGRGKIGEHDKGEGSYSYICFYFFTGDVRSFGVYEVVKRVKFERLDGKGYKSGVVIWDGNGAEGVAILWRRHFGRGWTLIETWNRSM